MSSVVQTCLDNWKKEAKVSFTPHALFNQQCKCQLSWCCQSIEKFLFVVINHRHCSDPFRFFSDNTQTSKCLSNTPLFLVCNRLHHRPILFHCITTRTQALCPPPKANNTIVADNNYSFEQTSIELLVRVPNKRRGKSDQSINHEGRFPLPMTSSKATICLPGHWCRVS